MARTLPATDLTILLLIIGSFLYLFPWIIALWRRHPHTTAIAVLTLCGGWTGLAWIAALTWAVMRISYPPAPYAPLAPYVSLSTHVPPPRTRQELQRIFRLREMEVLEEQ
jgi:hypothetical protein